MSAMRLAVLGDPVDHSRSPDLHRAGLAALGMTCESRAIHTPAGTLGERLRQLAAEGLTGVNLTHPLKAEALALVPRLSDGARLSGAVNTIGFAADGWWGESTDGPGCVDWMVELGHAAGSQRVVLLGGGGAGRSIAIALINAGARDVAVSVRNRSAAAITWAEASGARLVGWRTPEEHTALAAATTVVHATTLRTATDPAPLDAIGRDALILDVVYGETITPWVAAARADGRKAYDGLGLLVHQARHGLSRWTGRDVPLEPLARAVGWPR